MLEGEKPYQQRARLVLPILVRQAKAGQTIYYSDLAKEVGMSNPRTLNFPLGEIGDALKDLKKKTKTEIPPIQCVVVNKQNDLPGEGIEGFLVDGYSKLTKSEKRKKVKHLWSNVFGFTQWDWVLEQLGLSPLPIALSNEIEKAKKFKGGGGESESHKKFKTFIAEHPEVLGLGKKLKLEKIEYGLASGDTVDVLFTEKGTKVAVEVKSDISNVADILRGLFQCVKYKCVIEAEQIVQNQPQDSRAILALQGAFPCKLNSVKNVLGIEVVDEINID